MTVTIKRRIAQLLLISALALVADGGPGPDGLLATPSSPGDTCTSEPIGCYSTFIECEPWQGKTCELGEGCAGTTACTTLSNHLCGTTWVLWCLT